MWASFPVFAQDKPTGEVGVGYTFRSYGLPSIQQPPSRLTTNGWNISAEYNFTWRFGAAVELDLTRNDSEGARTGIATALIGPQIYPFGHHRVTPFVNAFFGPARFYFRFPCGCLGKGGGSDSFTEYNFAWSVGGGVDYTVRPNVAVRLLQFEFEEVNFDLRGFGTGPLPVQHNWKYSAALLLRF
jgi:opacity protein-like surface antigen